MDSVFRLSLDPDRTSWSRLIDDHDRIAKQCRDLVALTERRGLHCAQASRALLELAVLVADHLGVEDEIVDLTAVAMSVDRPQDAIDTMTAELDMLKGDWRIFIGHWLPTIAPADWLAFRGDAKAMCARLAYQVDRESALLYDSALRHGVVRLGSAVVH